MRVRSSTSALFLLGLSALSVACGGQAQDERVGDQFTNNGTGVAPGKGGTGGTVGKGGSGGTGGAGGTIGKGGSGGTGGAGGTIGKGGGPGLFCGDGVCSSEAGESCANCALDCGTCSGGAGGGGGSVPNTCSHDVCSVGPALGQACGKCESVVCANDPFCCEREWDFVCVQGAQDACGASCGIGGTGGTGGAGGSIGKGGAGGSVGKGGAGGGGGTGQGGKGGAPNTFCGDSICNPNEACNTCPQDCGPCGNACSHDVCIAGPPLGQNCGKCAAVVCQQDPFCCESFWDATCVSEASQCAPCGGGTAGSGGAPQQDCQSCAFGNCGPQVNACLQDPQCQSCLGSADPACFGNPRVKDLVVCTCNGSCAQSCAEECKVFGGGGTGGTGGTGGSGGGTGGAGGGPASVCGDGVCDGQETCGSCLNDCGSCDCAHGVCFTGGKLEGSCSPCTQKVCSQDPFCCSTEWDDQCVQRAQNSCGPEACVGGQPPKTDPHDACPGLPLTTLQKGSSTLLQGDTRIDRNDYEPSCVQGGVPGNDAVYAIQVAAKGTLVVQLFGGSELDPILSIKKACQGPGPLCENSGIGKGTSETIKREVEAGETAFVVVDAASGTSGPFKLQLDLF